MSNFDDAYNRMLQFGEVMLKKLEHSKTEIDAIRSGKEKLSPGCPSKASAVLMVLSGAVEKLHEVASAMKDAKSSIHVYQRK